MSFHSIAVKARTYRLLKKLRVQLAKELEGDVPSYDDVIYELFLRAGEIKVEE